MAHCARLPTSEPSNPRENNHQAIGPARQSEDPKLSGQHRQQCSVLSPTTDMPDESNESETIRNGNSRRTVGRNGNARGGGCERGGTHDEQGREYSQLGSGHFGRWIDTGRYLNHALERGYAQALTWATLMVAYAHVSFHTLPLSWIGMLVMSATLPYADARALPPRHSTRGRQKSGDGALPDTTDDISHSDSKLDHGPAIVKASVSTVNIIIIICIAVFWALVALASFGGGREHRIRAMGYICVFTLVAAAAPIVLRQAGGIEADVGGPLWVFWTGAYLNFVLRGALLVRHDQAGYLSPLFYIGTVAVSLSLVFVTADPQSSRLYTTLVALSITILHDVGLRAWFGGLHIQATRLPAHRSDSTSGTLH